MTKSKPSDNRYLLTGVQPHAMVGAGRLVSTLWKTGSERDGWRYSFNLFRLASSGRTGQRFRPDDVHSLVKLAKVLAAELAADGCLAPELHRELADLAAALDSIVPLQDDLADE